MTPGTTIGTLECFICLLPLNVAFLRQYYGANGLADKQRCEVSASLSIRTVKQPSAVVNERAEATTKKLRRGDAR
jgi:hypothetical protein